jgi:hypothetical protein
MTRTLSHWRGWTSRLVYPVVLLAFVALKLAGVTDWSWWWTLAPAWAPVAGLLLAGVLAALAFALVRWFIRAWVWLEVRKAVR